MMAKNVSWVLSALGLDKVIHLANRGVGGCILSYHHVSLAVLEGQLERLSRWYVIVPLVEFVSRLEQGKSTAGLVVVTFDDGFAKEVEDGAALAIRRGWPMTFYLPTGFVNTQEPLWFEEIGHLMRAAPKERYELNGLSFRLGDDRSCWQARNQVVRHLFYRPSSQIQRFMENLRETFFGSVGGLTNLLIPKSVSRERVRELSRNEEVSFEAHSVSHPFFSTLSPAKIREEMEMSRREVEEMTRKPVRHFCYPYGDRRAIGSQAPEIARSLFRSATTIARGRCHLSTDRALLPRIAMFEHYTTAMAALKVETTR